MKFKSSPENGTVFSPSIIFVSHSELLEITSQPWFPEMNEKPPVDVPSNGVKHQLNKLATCWYMIQYIKKLKYS